MEERSIVIIGAGLSGLYAARQLKKVYPDVLIVEAQNRIGGRIMCLDDVCPWPVQAGAEFIHGRHPILDGVLAEIGIEVQEKPWPDWWYFGKEGKLVNDADVGDEVNAVHDLFGDCAEHEVPPPPGQDENALDWVKRKGFTEKQIKIAEACYANDFSCSLRQLGLRESIHENKRWDSGESYLLPNCSMTAIPEHLSKGADIRVNWPVTHVQYNRSGAVLTGVDGRQVKCRKLIITVSLRCLQDSLITFSPPLPTWKQTAISRVKMGNALKIVLTFTESFWPEDMYDVVCTDTFVPEFWMLRNREVNPGVGTRHCVVGFVAGELADQVGAMDPNEAISRFVSQLDVIYGTMENPKPASSKLFQGRVFNWANEKFARGSYTYPCFGVEAEDREALAAPVADTVFFAGEATNADINPCMQGALATGKRVAEEVIRSLDCGVEVVSKL